MVHSRMHIICGNCGCASEFEFVIEPQGHDFTDREVCLKPAVFITCKNCSTLHDLSEFMTEKPSDSIFPDDLSREEYNQMRFHATKLSETIVKAMETIGDNNSLRYVLQEGLNSNGVFND